MNRKKLLLAGVLLCGWSAMAAAQGIGAPGGTWTGSGQHAIASLVLNAVMAALGIIPL